MNLRAPTIIVLASVASLAEPAWRFGGTLHPAAATESGALATSGARQGGTARYRGINEAAIWSGTGASVVRLHPPGASSSTVRGMSSTIQVGSFQVNGQNRACLWRSTAQSRINLHPIQNPTILSSTAVAISTRGATQVGYVGLAGYRYQACYWNGNTTSFRLIPLPNLASSSFASGIDQNTILGNVIYVNGNRAGFWRFPGSRWTSLHPSGATESYVYGASLGVQVGQIRVNNQDRATLWRSTNVSATSLHPTGATASGANAILTPWVAGWAIVGGVRSAYAFPSRAAGAVNLHRLLPDDYTSSWANSITLRGNQLVIVGQARTSEGTRAVFWVGP